MFAVYHAFLNTVCRKGGRVLTVAPNTILCAPAHALRPLKREDQNLETCDISLLYKLILYAHPSSLFL